MSRYRHPVDLHVHTDNSPDGHVPATLMCEQACRIGLRAIAFTDHCEADDYHTGSYDRSSKQAYFEVAKARSAFMGELVVLQGIELGQGHYEPEISEKILTEGVYDVVVGSVHNLRNRLDFYYIEDFSQMDVPALLREYFDEILQMAQWGDFDVLAHLTYPFRYFFARNGLLIDVDDYRDQVDEILRLCAEKDKALEINTGGLRQPLNRLSPEVSTVRRFRELGGRLISVGSDAHYTEHLGAGVDEACDAALEAGFREIAVYTRRIPNLVEIIPE